MAVQNRRGVSHSDNRTIAGGDVRRKNVLSYV